MCKTYKFRLYPTKPQQKQMERILELCRQVYNRTLEERKTAYAERGETLSRYTLNILRLGLQSVGIETVEAHEL